MRWANCLSTIYNTPKPVIALATGNVFGGGNGLLSASDIVIAQDNAVFSFSEVKLGLAPSTILPYALTRLNEHQAKYLMFTGKRISADEALSLGLVDFTVPSIGLEEKLNSITSDILNSSPSGVTEVKRLIRELKTTTSLDEIIDITSSSIAKLKISEEAREGISSFLEKRKPSWILNF
jgi:methylglutaconyl-CoA hydratase